MRPEVVLLEPDPELRLLVRTLLGRDGFKVTEAADEPQAADIVRGTRAQIVVSAGQASEAFPGVLARLHTARPDLDVLTPPGYGAALIEGAAERDSISDFARDALLLLSVLAEEGTRRPPAAERLGRLSELTAIKMGLSRLHVEACSAAAGLVALGPSLAAFRFAGVVQADEAAAAEMGLSRELQAALGATAALRSPFDLRAIVEAVEEHVDGSGRPRGLSADMIPLEARVIAVAREYSYRLAEGEEQVVASEEVRRKSGTRYDPQVVDAFFRALRDDSYLHRMESGQRGARVLFVDGDEGALAVGELRLAAAGFRVTTCQDGNQAFELISANPPDVVIADTVLPRMDGISLLLKLRRQPNTQDVPVVFVSSRTDGALLNKALKLGAKDVLAKPVNYDVLVAKLRAVATQAQTISTGHSTGGVLGDLSEMPLTDFLQVLSLGRKTVKVEISSARGHGEIYFDQGAPVAAIAGAMRGVEAFSHLISWEAGTFRLINAAGAPEHNLEHSLDALLLQGAWDRQRPGPDPFAPPSHEAQQDDPFQVDPDEPNPYGAPTQIPIEDLDIDFS